MYLEASGSGYSGYKYKFSNVDSLSWRGNTNPVVVSLPNEDAMIVGNFEGIRKIQSIAWNIKNESFDVALGSYTSQVKTIKEQIDYLSSYFVNADVTLVVKVVIESDDWGEEAIFNMKPYSFSWSWRGGQQVVSARIEGIVSDIVV